MPAWVQDALSIYETLDEGARPEEFQGLDIESYSAVIAHDLLGLDLLAPTDPIGILHKRRPKRTLDSQQQQMQRRGDEHYIVKPYNALLNWKKLLSNVPENALIVGGAASASWMMVVAALVIARKVLEMQEIRLTGDQATVLLVLAATCGNARPVQVEELQRSVANHLETCRLPSVSNARFHATIDELSRLRSVDLAEGRITLVEAVPVTLIREITVPARGAVVTEPTAGGSARAR